VESQIICVTNPMRLRKRLIGLKVPEVFMTFS